MIELTRNGSSQGPSRSLTWHDLADRVLDGMSLATEEGLAILRSPDEELLDVLSAAFRVRQRYFGKTVHLCFLMNAKSGLCGEDCHYCSQSRLSTADIPKYRVLQQDQLLEGARMAVERGAQTYCVVISNSDVDTPPENLILSYITEHPRKRIGTDGKLSDGTGMLIAMSELLQMICLRTTANMWLVS